MRAGSPVLRFGFMAPLACVVAPLLTPSYATWFRFAYILAQLGCVQLGALLDVCVCIIVSHSHLTHTDRLRIYKLNKAPPCTDTVPCVTKRSHGEINKVLIDQKVN